jgi:pyruvate, water dikinase
MVQPGPRIVSLTDLEARNVRQYGGKIANLAQLTATSVPVPWGLGLGKHVLAQFLSENGIDLTALERIHSRGMIFLESALTEAQVWLERITETIKNGAMPSAIESAIGAKIPNPNARFAVRSSCVVEDGSTASFAGQYVTKLDVSGFAEIMEAVRACWVSQYDSRALSYALARRGVPVLVPSMAVAIQEMLNPEFAGVCFTEGPTPKTKEVAIVESVVGVGEALVSGEKTPAHFEIDKSGSIRRAAVRGQSAGGVDSPSDEQVTMIVEEARKIATFFGRAQDVEWAIAGGRLFVLQARPITVVGGDRKSKTLVGLLGGATIPSEKTLDSDGAALRDDLHEWIMTQIDPLVYRGATYLFSKQQQLGSWGVEGHPEWDCVTTALVVQLLLKGGVPGMLSWSFSDATDGAAGGGIQSALRWLVQQVNSDGSWGTDLWDTCQVIRTLLQSGATVQEPIVTRGVNYVTEQLASGSGPAGQEWAGAGFLALLIHVLYEIDRKPLLGEFGSRLIATQTAVGDFPASSDAGSEDVPSEWHTAQAITALSRCCRDNTRAVEAAERAREWLVSRQNSDGSWGVTRGPYAHYNTFFTSYAVIALGDGGETRSAVVNKAVRWLRGKQLASGSFGDSASSLMVMTALQETQGPLFTIQLPLPLFLRIQSCLR